MHIVKIALGSKSNTSYMSVCRYGFTPSVYVLILKTADAHADQMHMWLNSNIQCRHLE